MALRKMRIVALAPNHWDGPWMNRQNLLSRLAKDHSIVYSNGLWHSWERDGADYRASPLFGRFDDRGGVSVDRAPRLLLRIPRWPLLEGGAIDLGCLRLRRQLAGREGPLVAHVFHPEFLPYAKRLRADFLVYHAYDLFRFMGTTSGEVEKPEDELLERADLVIATSSETARDFRSRTRRRIHVLGNGVEWSRFAVAPKPTLPPEFADVPEPRIGYAGAINQKVDIPLIERLARRQPGWQIVLFGGVRSLLPGDQEILSTMRALPNVHFFGEVDQQRIPSILLNLQVGLIPYRALDWTLAGYPLKLLEYLAAGLPAVASDLPSVREFAAVTAIARTPSEWETAIADAIAGRGQGDPESRLAAAKANSWDNRAAQLQELMAAMVQGTITREISEPDRSAAGADTP